jgi:hypothetical protein
MAFRHCLHTSQPDANSKMEIIMTTSNLKSGIWFAIGMAVCLTSSNLAFADSLTTPGKQTTSSASVIALETKPSIVAIVEHCVSGTVDHCFVDVTRRQIQLDQSELNWVLKFGGPR